jgi:HSP20 family protein
MDRLFSDVFGDSFGRMGGDDGGMATFHLPVDIKETENGYVINAPVPGFNPEDVEITFSDGVLTINATRREEREEPEGQYLRREIAFGNYQRRIALPGDIQPDGISASFDNGVLTVEGDQSRQAQSPDMRQTEGRAQASDMGDASSDAQPGAEAQQQPSEASRSEASSRS